MAYSPPIIPEDKEEPYSSRAPISSAHQRQIPPQTHHPLNQTSHPKRHLPPSSNRNRRTDRTRARLRKRLRLPPPRRESQWWFSYIALFCFNIFTFTEPSLACHYVFMGGSVYQHLRYFYWRKRIHIYNVAR